jgi:hypothetical protein
LRRTKIGDYDVEEAVDVVVFEDNLESHNLCFETFKDAIIRTLFWKCFAQDKKLTYTQFEVGFHRKPKREKLISVRT